MLPRISKIKCMMFLPLIRLEGPKLKISASKNIHELKYNTGVSLCKERRIKRLIFGLIIVKVRKTLKNYKKIIKKKKSKNMSVLYA